jgi:hypothetical protein
MADYMWTMGRPLSIDQIEQFAKDYVWDNGNGDTIRSFVKYLRSQSRGIAMYPTRSKHVSEEVERILEWYPETRNSDKKLLLRYYDQHGLHLTEEQADIFLSIKSPETIRRTRQKIQESGKYPATENVRRTRAHMSMVIQQNMPSAKPKYMDRLFDDAEYRRNGF